MSDETQIEGLSKEETRAASAAIRRTSYGRKHPMIEVTEDIIQASLPKNSSHCMIADAVKIAVPEAEYVSVDLQSIRWSDAKRGRRYIYLTPYPAQLALIDFDQGRMPRPFKFRLRSRQSILSSPGRKDRRKRYLEASASSEITKKIEMEEPTSGGDSIPGSSSDTRVSNAESISISAPEKTLRVPRQERRFLSPEVTTQGRIPDIEGGAAPRRYNTQKREFGIRMYQK